ncbi:MULTISPECIES: LLM class flavin-dependent oxidoreductase [unclassified Solwaraspora]|uniref:LLM class flavin-dependent oxidoreductase n=1 Tax=unclassified Solwaraspora TaxID=2627926 RepID=UPI00248BD668|nr:MULTISPECIES: LLM class flavin-dependent oxidoreductase [unclassified Solwaraspora]WBB95636.1 LLM class flavin-dependent oxidoreductase [Solwaraspora sp. WMMA2059]WBC20460.1 LLM class flavin-dependent oxidoreductase [Solwaraspora sp. WMMA2080]WJK37387.1 LLM class flavin-dependent oxidoreductase [Solwaraspora sp. WMMA2065]
MSVIDQPFRIGVLLPTREQAITDNIDMAQILDFARRAELLGFDSLWTGDSLVARPRLDPLVVLAACAAVTSQVTLGTAAMTPALRHPLIGANMIASLDHACAGRLALGLGSGFPIPETEEEFGIVGAVFPGRASRLDEIADLWRAAWGASRSDGQVDFTGRYWQASGLHRLPTPYRTGGPPLWLASSDTPRVLRRVAERYDGWLPFLPTASAYDTAWQTVLAHCRELGRPQGAVTPGLYATVTIGDSKAEAEAELADYLHRYYGRSLETMARIQAYGWGRAEECADWLLGYLRSGTRHVVIRIGSLDPSRQLDQLGAVVLPALREAAVPLATT